MVIRGYGSQALRAAAIMQDRIGANRASIFGIRILGLLHPLADAVKMLTKEDSRRARTG